MARWAETEDTGLPEEDNIYCYRTTNRAGEAWGLDSFSLRSVQSAPSLGASITLSSLQEAESVATALTAGHDCYSTKPVPMMEAGRENPSLQNK